jgi:hypothetical protein
MKIIISIVVIMFYAVIGCFISKMMDEEYDPLYILFWPIVIACFIPIWIVSGILEGFGWLSRRLRKHKSVYTHIEWRHNSDDSPYDQLLKAKQAIERTRNINFKDMSEYIAAHNNEHPEGIERIRGIDDIEDKITKPFHELLAGTEDDLKVAEYMLDKERRALLITMMYTVGRLSPDVECLAEEWAAKRKALDERKVAINREKGADRDE